MTSECGSPGAIGRLFASAEKSEANSEPIHHPVLGHLEPIVGLKDTFGRDISTAIGTLELQVSLDGSDVEPVFALVTQVVERLSELNNKCLEALVAEALDAYNNEWRFGTVARTDGSTEDFEKPELSDKAFRSEFRLTTIAVTGESLVTMWYDCGDLFWGHVFSVTSFDGVAFGDLHVEMQG